MTLTRPILLYDDACGRCRRFAMLVRALNLGARVEVAVLDGPRAEALLPHLSRFERLEAMRFLTPAGAHFTAAEAASELFAWLASTAWAWRPLRRGLPFLRGAVRWLYGQAEQTRKCEVPR